MEDKIPPQDLDAEQSVLGSMMMSKDAIALAIHKMHPDYFYRQAHVHVFKSIVSLYSKNEPVDLVTVSSELKKADALDSIGGRSYLADVLEAVPTSSNVLKYVKIVTEKAMLRKLIGTGSDIIKESFEDTHDVDVVLEKAQKSILDLTRERVQDGFVKLDSVLKTVFDDIQNVYDNDEKILGVPTGYPDFDAITSGFQPGDLVILAARPAMGKTCLALIFAMNAAVDRQIPVAVFSLEMPKEQLAMRLLSAGSKLDSKRLRTANLMEHEYRDLVQALGKLSEAPIFIDDSAAMSPLELRAKVRRLQMESDIKLIVIDYLQLMRGSSRRSEGRFHEVSEIVREIKAFAKESGIPIIALSQLSRDVEKRAADDRRPRLSDLRESGEIEQTADLVMFIHRDDYYQTPTETPEQEYQLPSPCEVILAKHRNGPTGKVNMMFKKEHSTFYSCDMAPVPAE